MVGMEETFAPRLENSRLRTAFYPFCPSLPGLSCATQPGVISHQAAGDGRPCKGLTQPLSPLSHVDGLILGMFLVLNQRNCFRVSLLSRYPSFANVCSSEVGQSRPSLWKVASSHFSTSMRRRKRRFTYITNGRSWGGATSRPPVSSCGSHRKRGRSTFVPNPRHPFPPGSGR